MVFASLMTAHLFPTDAESASTITADTNVLKWPEYFSCEVGLATVAGF